MLTFQRTKFSVDKIFGSFVRQNLIRKVSPSPEQLGGNVTYLIDL